ncbi:MAG: hypothetical protein CL529_12700 [Aequorivita sp.]|mgnify:CR=1 FL=1|nr:hypothetical protein [Aequorivita sp.]|tara:strand:+ start:19685 stop:19915 length:231 start_codon:yes stop_codon:yes gene_type:complete
MAIGEILAVGKTAGEVVKGILEKLPSDKQKALRKYFEFLDKFNEEISRQDNDFDTVLAYHERKKALERSFIGEIKK